jgi:hypothetical protein
MHLIRMWKDAYNASVKVLFQHLLPEWAEGNHKQNR